MGKRVLMLDDDRSGPSSFLSNSIGPFEKVYLQFLGRETGIEPLENLDNYLQLAPYCFIVGDKRMKLGGDYEQNILELVRKFPGLNKFQKELIGNKKIFKSLEVFFQRMAQEMFYFRSLQGVNTKLFEEHFPTELKPMLREFKKIVDVKRPFYKRKETLSSYFLFLGRSYYQNTLALSASDFDLLHILSHMMAPRFDLNRKELYKDLMPYYEECGGDFKKAEVRDIIFDQKRPWCLELSSYEGVIHPKDVYIFTGRIPQAGLEVKPQQETAIALQGSWVFNDDLPEELQNLRMIYTDEDKFGTDLPVVAVQILKREITGLVLLKEVQGMKESFYQKSFVSTIESCFGDELPFHEGHFEKDKLEFSFEGQEWEKKARVPVLRGTNARVDLFEKRLGAKQSKIRNVHYIGPLYGHPLGRLSALMKAKQLH